MKKEVKASMIIRSLETVEELEEVRRLESIVWSNEDSIPVHQNMAAVKNGGFILGAFYEKMLIGFQYSFPGFNSEQVYLVSHSLGIHPDFQRFGVGERLKIAQKETAKDMGYELITWTYDPLETVNGNLNLHKLGAIVKTYILNVYGEMADSLNIGIPTDRFLVEWWMKGSIERRVDEANFVSAILTSGKNEFRIPEKIDLSLNNDRIIVPVPGQFQEIKKADITLAKAWREKTREVFSHYLSQGWMVKDLVKDEAYQGQYLYLLEKGV